MNEKPNILPPELAEVYNANLGNNSLVTIPSKSKNLYKDSYKRLVKFCEEQRVVNFPESVLLAYFSKLSQQYKKSTLMTYFSMIKAELHIRHNINLYTYSKLISFMKQIRKRRDILSSELAELANAGVINSEVPEKSKQLYKDSYKRLVKFCEEQQAVNFPENVLLAYFSKLSKHNKNSTLLTNFSMVKAELNIRHSIDLNTYTKLIAFMKQKGERYKVEDSRVLTKQQFDDFLENAPDNAFLATKVVLIFGVTGACRCDELLNLTINDIRDLDKFILVKIHGNETKKSRSFTIMGDIYVNLYRKYVALRPTHLTSARFFIKYQNNSCRRVVMGKQRIAQTAKDVATFLKLPNASEYTGQCFRKTSAKLLTDNGLEAFLL